MHFPQVALHMLSGDSESARPLGLAQEWPSEIANLKINHIDSTPAVFFS